MMNEFMGLIHGMYEAKQDGFLPGELVSQQYCFETRRMCY
jgi:homogentisate 1,2-dioxygenase